MAVHTPDLPIWNDASIKLGLGLWNYPIVTYALEAGLLLAALWFYLASSSAVSPVGKYGMGVFVVILILINIVNIFGPLPGDSKLVLTVSALTSYFLFAGVAFWLDKKRA